MTKLQITIELVTTEKKVVKGDWVVVKSVRDAENGRIIEAERGYAPDREMDVTTVQEVYKQEIELTNHESRLQHIIKAVNGMVD